MRLFFMICLVTCLVTAFAPAVTNESGDRAPVAALLVAPPAAAHPVLLVLEPPATPTPKPTPRPPTPRPGDAPAGDARAHSGPHAHAHHHPRSHAHTEPDTDPHTISVTETEPDHVPDDDHLHEGSGEGRDPPRVGRRRRRGHSRGRLRERLNPRATNGPNLGLWQFRIETWRNYGGSGDPRDHSPEEQTRVAWRLYSERGWAPWPGCT